MVFGVDYDGTISRCSDLRAVCSYLASKGHTIVCVTGRSREHGDQVLDDIGDLVPVVFAGKRWKVVAAAAAGYVVDVWIDDNPEYVGPQNLLLKRNKSQMVSDFTMSLVIACARILRNIWAFRNPKEFGINVKAD